MNATNQTGWLHGREFDLFFIVAIPMIAIASGLLVTYDNDLFLPVLAADLWILGYHHVVATYTRLTFDKQSFLENKALVLYLPPAVALAVVLLATLGGPWVVTTIYLYWQWYHYTRQSEGISKAYAGRSGNKQLGQSQILRLAFYSVPITGILAVSHRSPDHFLFFPLKTFPVPELALNIAIAATVILLAIWLFEQVKAYRLKTFSLPYVLYVVSHITVYFFAYIYHRELNYGWLTINIWHNAQYILFVWLYNNRRFGGRANDAQRFLSTISQNGRFALYFVTCLTISTLIYFLIIAFLSPVVSAAFTLTATMAGLIIYQTINFHHYIVDSLIWKLRKPKLRQNLGLA